MTRHWVVYPFILGILCGVVFFSHPIFCQSYRLLSPEVLDMGRVLEGKQIEGDVRFVNTGQAPLRIERVQTSCGCTAAKSEKTDYAPNDTAHVHFTLRTTGFHGLIRKSLTVYFKDPAVNDLTVMIQATVFSELEVKPTFISFQPIPLRKDTSATADIRILNASDHPVRILNIRSDSDQIHVKFQPCSIPPNQEISVQAVLKPQKAEYRDAVLTIETDNPDKSKILIPVFFNIHE